MGTAKIILISCFCCEFLALCCEFLTLSLWPEKLLQTIQEEAMQGEGGLMADGR